MKVFTVLFAVNVQHYGRKEIEAETAAQAVALAKALDPAEFCNDQDRSSAECARIVFISDVDGNTVAEGVALDGAFIRHGGHAAWLLCEKAPALLQSLELMIAGADALMGAIAGETDRFECQVLRLADAATAAERLMAAIRGSV